MPAKGFWSKIFLCAGFLSDFCVCYDCIIYPDLPFFQGFLGVLVMLKQQIPLCSLLNSAIIIKRKCSCVRAKFPDLSLHTFTAELCYLSSFVLMIE